MEYIDFGNTGLRVSRFGLGCMRFPPDKAEAIKLVHCAVDNGVNYLDTAYVYGQSENITGEAMQNGYRDRVNLATKSPIWNINDHADFEKYLDEELKRLKTDHIDVYLLHNMNPENWKKVKKYDGFTFLDKMIDKGKIRHKGFSIHNTTEAFKEIINTFDWEMAQIQLNILDENQQVGIAGLKIGADKGLAMVIMEPLRGGSILNNIPDEVKTLMDTYRENRSLAEWCFRWLYNMPEISVILSGTSTMDQVKDNLHIFEHSSANVMSEQDMDFIHKIQAAYESKKVIGCTGCKYCIPCPQGINIPGVFNFYNNYIYLNKPAGDKLFYQGNIVGGDKCVSCNNCKEHCPQRLEIPELLKEIHKELTMP
jgi:predicted aldo/keto reductase-like oxidoreductase